MAASCLSATQTRFSQVRPDLDVDDLLDDLDDADDVFDRDIEESFASQVAAALQPLDHDSKFDALQARLLELRNLGTKQAMIFSTFRGTLSYLERRLSGTFKVGVLHGGVRMQDRLPIMERFRAGEFELLLLSEVGSEGLDFEFCNTIVNYDLPWNPMRVEQRIGRIDRFGQQSEKVFIFNMFVPETIESDILGRLYDRIGLFRDSIGDLEPILRDEMAEVQRLALDPRLTREQKRAQLDRIAVAAKEKGCSQGSREAAGGVLAVADQLRIDGMTDDGPSGGRFVGVSEVRSALEHLFSRCGGSVSAVNADGIAVLTGSAELASALRREQGAIDNTGSMYHVGKLASLLRDGVKLNVTFDTSIASQHDVELLSIRHPLVRLAVQEMGKDSLDLKRFGAVRVPNLPAGRTWIAQVDVAETLGVRPLLELWVTAVDLETGMEAPEVADQLLVALADGTLQDLRGPAPHVDAGVLESIDQHGATRRVTLEVERRKDNEALVDARIEARVKSLGLKLDKARETLAKVQADGRDDSIVRLHRGRVRNLADDLEQVEPNLAAKRHLTVSRNPVAAVVIQGS